MWSGGVGAVESEKALDVAERPRKLVRRDPTPPRLPRSVPSTVDSQVAPKQKRWSGEECNAFIEQSVAALVEDSTLALGGDAMGKRTVRELCGAVRTMAATVPVR